MPSVVVTSLVEIEGLPPLRYLNSFVMDSSVDNLTTTATLTLPRTATVDRDRTDQRYKPGKTISVSLGYDHQNRLVFKGYIARVRPGADVVLELEDEMWQFKAGRKNLSYKDAKLSQVLTDLGFDNFDSPEIKLGKFSVNNASPAKALKEIFDFYALRARWLLEDGIPKLVVGRDYRPDREWKYSFGVNVIDFDSLEYARAEDVPMQIRAINKLTAGGKEEALVPEEVEGNPDIRTMHFVDTPDFKALAEEELTQSRYDGYRGQFVSFGDSPLSHPIEAGDVVVLSDRRFPERAGSYFADGVRIDAGVGGYFRTITLGRKAA